MANNKANCGLYLIAISQYNNFFSERVHVPYFIKMEGIVLQH
jgi:hypothetical protein